VAAGVLAGVTLALVTQNRHLASGEEHLLAWALDAGKHGAEPPVVIDLLGHEPTHGELAHEIETLVKGGAAAIGVALPLDRPSLDCNAPDETQLAIVLRGSQHVAVMSRLAEGHIVFPPLCLAGKLPSGIRELDLPRHGPLVHRIRRTEISGTPQTLAAAVWVAFKQPGQPEIDDDAIGRLPWDRLRATAVVAATGPGADIKGKIVLVAVKADDAQPTADALTALLRVNTPLHTVGADDALLVLVFAFAGAVAGFALRPLRAGPAVAGLMSLAFVAGFVISMQGRPLLTLGATLAVPLAAGPLALARAAVLFLRRTWLRRAIASRTTRSVAIDLVAQPEHLVPMRRRMCVLVADLVERVGTNVGMPVDIVRAVELHEQRVLEAVRHYGGIVDRFDGDRVVACFSMETDGTGMLLAAQAGLEIIGSGGGTTAVGLDAGEALSGIFGVDRRYRVQGEVVRRAARAARVAASRNVGVAATGVVWREIEKRLQTRPIGKDAELELYEIVGERRHEERSEFSEEQTVPR
jgi:class 3 adenylate cyclase